MSMSQKWYRRHVVISHPDRKIYIQIFWAGDGELNIQEFTDIAKGVWFPYVPATMIEEIRHGITSGYQVQPVAIVGNGVGEMHQVMQLIEIRDSRGIITDAKANILNPISEN